MEMKYQSLHDYLNDPQNFNENEKDSKTIEEEIKNKNFQEIQEIYEKSLKNL